MKKVIFPCFFLLCSIFLFGCTLTNENALSETETFSYEEVVSFYTPLKGEAGIHFDGFVNTRETIVKNAQQAAVLAKAECKGEYTDVSTRFDTDTNMWEVNFSQNIPEEDYLVSGGCVSVYLTDKGITTLIVAGE